MSNFSTTIVFLVFLILLFSTFISIINGAPLVMTDKKALKKLVSIAKIKKVLKVVDLGSGDGRVVIEFAKKGIQAHGYEINPFLVILTFVNIRAKGLSNKAFVHWKNFWKIDLSDYDLVVIYGIGHIMSRLEKKLKKELKKGAQVISLAYKFPNWKVTKKLGSIYLYEVK